MTLPYERARSITFARSVLIGLLADDRDVDKLSEETQQMIRSALRHYPTEYDIRMLAERSPDILFIEDEFE